MYLEIEFEKRTIKKLLTIKQLQWRPTFKVTF